jgi:hypothetical protein
MISIKHLTRSASFKENCGAVGPPVKLRRHSHKRTYVQVQDEIYFILVVHSVQMHIALYMCLILHPC